jgi:hypothetical protein
MFKQKMFAVVMAIAISTIGFSGFAQVSQAVSFYITGPVNVANLNGGTGSPTPGGKYIVYSPGASFDGVPTVYINNVAQTTVSYTNTSVSFVLGTNWNAGQSLSLQVKTNAGSVSSNTLTFQAGSGDPALFSCNTGDPIIYNHDTGAPVGKCPDGQNVALVAGTNVEFRGNAFKPNTTKADISISVQGNYFAIADLTINASNEWVIQAYVPTNVSTGSQQVIFSVNGKNMNFIVNFDAPTREPRRDPFQGINQRIICPANTRGCSSNPVLPIIRGI